MNTKIITMAVAGALASAFTLTPLSARAMTTGSPVAIDSCVVPGYSNTNMIGDAPSVGTGGVKIVFHDGAPSKVTQVTFRVGYADNVTTIHDVGSFSSGVPIVHQYEHFNDSDYAGSRPTTCEVVSAKFADGLVWTPSGQYAANAVSTFATSASSKSR